MIIIENYVILLLYVQSLRWF